MSDLPAGWGRSSLSDAASVVLGQSPPGSSYNSEGVGIPFSKARPSLDPDCNGEEVDNRAEEVRKAG